MTMYQTNLSAYFVSVDLRIKREFLVTVVPTHVSQDARLRAFISNVNKFDGSPYTPTLILPRMEKTFFLCSGRKTVGSLGVPYHNNIITHLEMNVA